MSTAGAIVVVVVLLVLLVLLVLVVLLVRWWWSLVTGVPPKASQSGEVAPAPATNWAKALPAML